MYGEVNGITTFQFAVGASAVAHLSMAPNVIGTDILFVSGGTLFISGQSLTHADALSNGAFVASTGYKIEGSADLYLVAGGGAATAHIVRKLGEGFKGSY